MDNIEKFERRKMLNSTLTDLRRRVDTLAKSIYLIGGGAIVLSVNLYLVKKGQLDKVLCYLKTSWILFGISIFLFAVVTGLLIFQGFTSSEFYRKKIENNEKIEEQPKRSLDKVALVCGILGFLSFVLGLFFLILSAYKL